ncbi:MAG: hypothetical protein WCK51_04855 [Armatimonadota bacterium]
MAYRSWLKAVKHVGDLAQQFVPYDDCKPEASKRNKLSDERWLDAMKRQIPVAPEFLRYFGTRMHDSWVISQERTGDHIRIELDSIEGNVFCSQYGLWLDVEFPEPLMPVELYCHDVRYARWARHDKTGWLKFAEPEFREIDPTRTMSDSFTYDFFFEQDGRIQWIALIRAWPRYSDWHISDLFLMADCSGVSAVDHRANVILNHFGAKAGLMWHQFFNQTEFDAWDQPQLFALFKSVSEREGWTKNDLRQELLQVPGARTLNSSKSPAQEL